MCPFKYNRGFHGVDGARTKVRDPHFAAPETRSLTSASRAYRRALRVPNVTQGENARYSSKSDRLQPAIHARSASINRIPRPLPVENHNADARLQRVKLKSAS